jgi:hypothetical protein
MKIKHTAERAEAQRNIIHFNKIIDLSVENSKVAI